MMPSGAGPPLLTQSYLSIYASISIDSSVQVKLAMVDFIIDPAAIFYLFPLAPRPSSTCMN